jgi:hypothetical protein
MNQFFSNTLFPIALVTGGFVMCCEFPHEAFSSISASRGMMEIEFIPIQYKAAPDVGCVQRSGTHQTLSRGAFRVAPHTLR